MMLSIILPAYNEARCIQSSMEEMRLKMPSICAEIANHLGSELSTSFEIIIVNDGSTDRTGEIVRQYIDEFPSFNLRLIELSANYGKGYAVKVGIKSASGKYLIFMDADLSTSLMELPKLIHAIQREKSMAIGSRGLHQSRIINHQPIYRELMGKFFNLLVRLIVIKNIRDTQCGFKAFRYDDAKRIFSLLQTHRFGFDVEILLIAQELGISIQEIPITWSNSIYSSVSPVRDSWEMFCSLLQMKQRVRHSLLSTPSPEKILHG